MKDDFLNNPYFFLEGGGECGKLLRAIDWKNTSIGSPHKWSPIIKSTIKMMLDAPTAICLFIGNDFIQLYNDALIPSLGKTRHPVNLGKPAQQTSQAWDFVKPMFTKIMNGQSVFLKEIKLTLDKSGYPEECTMDLSYIPIYLEDGSIGGIHCTVIEITDKLMAIAELQASEAKFREMIMQAPVAIGVLRGKDFIVESGNQPILAFWGKDHSIIGQPILEALPQIEGTGYIELLENVYQTGKPFHGYAVLAKIYKKGTTKDAYFDFVYAPLKNSQGVIDGVLVIVSDVSKQVIATKAIEESELKFRSLIEEAPIATAVYIGRELRIEIANDAMIRYWGKGKEVFGRLLKDVLPELEGQAFLQILDEVFITGKTVEFKATKVDLTMNGIPDSYYFDFTYKALRNAAGTIYGILNMATDVTEQVMAKWQLEKSQQQLLTYFEQSPVAIAMINKENLTFSMVNPFYAELVNRKPETLENKPLLEALPELIGQGFDKLLEEVITTRIPHIANEVKLQLFRNGKQETIYLNFNYQPQIDFGNQVTGILVVAIDITQQVLARQNVEKSEAKLKSVITAAPFAISVFSGNDFIIEMSNHAFLKMVGKEEVIIGQALTKAVPELIDESQPFLEFLKYVFHSGKTFQHYAVPTKMLHDGIVVESFFDITYTPLFDVHQNVYAVLVISTDVTEQRKSLKKIAEAEASLRGAIELAGLSTWSLNINEGTFTYSPRFMDWLGFSEDTKTLNEAYNPLPDGFRTSVPEAIAKAIAVGSSGFYENIHPIINRLTGQKRIIRASGQLFYDNKGNPMTLRGTAQDITLQQEMQLALTHEVEARTEELASALEELQSNNEEMEQVNLNLSRSNEELSQYAYIASHDLQEPLRKIRVFSSILSTQGTLAPDDKRLVEKIETSASRMSLLIKDLLEFSKLVKSDKMQRPVDLNHTVKEVITDFELIIAEKQARITVGYLPTIEAVSLQMNQLFYNIIGNALKFVSEHQTPEIIIGSKTLSEEEVLNFIRKPKLNTTYHDIYVTDNGIGFNIAFSEQIFEVFKRLHGQNIYPGSGIGLALCRRIVTNHDGYLYPESQEGIGTTFHIILPLTLKSNTCP